MKASKVAGVAALGTAAGCLPPIPEPPQSSDGSSGPGPGSGSGTSRGDTTTLEPGTTAAETTGGRGTLDGPGDSGDTTLGGSDSSGDTGASGAFLRDYGACVHTSSNQLYDFVPDGIEVECVLEQGPYAGTMPETMQWDPVLCEPTGRNLDAWDPEDPMVDAIERVGVWAFIVEVTHPEGMVQHVPVCIGRGSNRTPYDIFAINPDGTDITQPRVLSFVPGGDVALTTGDGTRIEIVSEGSCAGMACDEQAMIVQYTSGGGIWLPSLTLSAPGAAGFDATLGIPPVQVDEVRPVVVHMDLLACLESDEGFCGNVPFHARGPLSYAVIFHPEVK